ncbi:MAG: DUF1156 domain-containing protein [Candidatus Aureabacteria bacterium]|nr:DUF1156 domain-containing protein [Candidatus Auribacterota bacterium]
MKTCSLSPPFGVECMRERGSANALAPHTYLHVWWARRPLTVSRSAAIG